MKKTRKIKRRTNNKISHRVRRSRLRSIRKSVGRRKGKSKNNKRTRKTNLKINKRIKVISKRRKIKGGEPFDNIKNKIRGDGRLFKTTRHSLKNIKNAGRNDGPKAAISRTGKEIKDGITRYFSNEGNVNSNVYGVEGVEGVDGVDGDGDEKEE